MIFYASSDECNELLSRSFHNGKAMISTSKRIQMIAKVLQEKGFVKAKDLSNKFGVSMETIRKDLIYLEDRGVAQKEYGGASLSTLGTEKAMEYRKIQVDEKKEIGKCIASLLVDKHSVFLGAGTTVLSAIEFINLLPGMDIITNSVSVFELLNGNVHNVFLTGGKKREKNQSLVGNRTERLIDSIHMDICVLGTAGILDSRGPTAHSYQELTTQNKVIEHSDYVYIACDHTKFQENGFHTICEWSDVDGLITDSSLSKNVYHTMSKIVHVIIGKDWD